MMQEITYNNCLSGYGVSHSLRNNARMIKTPVQLAIEIRKGSGHKITGEELADKLGISAPHVSRLKTGKSATTTDVIAKLAEICEITESEFYRLLGSDGDVRSEAAQNVSGTEPDEPLLFKPALFEAAVAETRKLDAKYAKGQAASKNFNALMHAIYKFIDAEGIDNLPTD
ncbi:MAG: helix-turn-helix domain-containing protein [Roseibium sp.]|uniref:helix-turn-helix domain-containing protein n=1 Tax=Roseibium sp. TaxID=1936156 RepID=UPI0026110968|nr:helix-turn-helix transcriptional regulator [Roseibium sp.]MCV0429282.1 helix-turn-helix domain-containing protein [Roseibium sp.]